MGEREVHRGGRGSGGGGLREGERERERREGERTPHGDNSEVKIIKFKTIKSTLTCPTR